MWRSEIIMTCQKPPFQLIKLFKLCGEIFRFLVLYNFIKQQREETFPLKLPFVINRPKDQYFKLPRAKIKTRTLKWFYLSWVLNNVFPIYELFSLNFTKFIQKYFYWPHFTQNLLNIFLVLKGMLREA